MNPHQIVEAVLFASDAPITADEISRADERLDEDQVELAIRQLQAEYDDAERSFQIVEVAEGYQILTRPEFAPYLERFDNVPRPSRLSGPALERPAVQPAHPRRCLARSTGGRCARWTRPGMPPSGARCV